MREFMVRKAVLDEPKIRTSNARHVDRLVVWLGAHGFAKLDARRLISWIHSLLKRRIAYGSVVILPRGVVPVELLAGPRGEPLWVRYMRGGGRIVHLGGMPFSTAESANLEPTDAHAYWNGPALLGLNHSWSSPYCGKADLPLSRTTAAEQWGLEEADSPLTGVPIENVTQAFHTYEVDHTKRLGASDWFRNLRADLPWSGLVKIQQAFDGSRDSSLRDVWRAAHYAGVPISVPPIEPAVSIHGSARPGSSASPAASGLTLVAGGIEGRTEFSRCERVEVRPASLRDSSRRLSIRSLVSSYEIHVAIDGGRIDVDTCRLAEGRYRVTLEVAHPDGKTQIHEQTIGIHELPHRTPFYFGIWHSVERSDTRTDLELASIRDHGMEVLLSDWDRGILDSTVRNHLSFVIRAVPPLPSAPEAFRIGPNGAPIPHICRGGRPATSIAHAWVQKQSEAYIEGRVRSVAGLPNFRPYVLVNDDFSCFYGWDYSPEVVRRFHRETGEHPPWARVLPRNFGPVPNETPWLTWFTWTLRNVAGAFNRAEVKGAARARADVLVGPIPGGAQVPFVQLEEPSQYPPLTFGTDGFNLVSSYYYNSRWQPIVATTFWMEIGRMANRELRQISITDAVGDSAYTRSSFYHHVAGGVGGIGYFHYGARSRGAWRELRWLSTQMARLGAIQAKLKPSHRTLGFLNSFTTNVFRSTHTIEQAFAYSNILQAKYSAEVISEADLTRASDLRYSAIVLHGITYLSEAAFRALTDFAARGGKILVDSTVPFHVPHSLRLGVNLGTGQAATGADEEDRAPGGIQFYDSEERLATVARALGKHVKPDFQASGNGLVVSHFDFDGTKYSWFVRCESGAAFRSARAHTTAETSSGDTVLPRHAEYVPVELESVPGIPYDLVTGGRLAVTRTSRALYRVHLRIPPLAGTLVVWRRAPLSGIELIAPSRALRGEPIHVDVRVREVAPKRTNSTHDPVEFVLVSPRGARHPISQVQVTNSGVASLSWTPAENDLTGRWTLRVTDLTSGAHKRHSLIIR